MWSIVGSSILKYTLAIAFITYLQTRNIMAMCAMENIRKAPLLAQFLKVLPEHLIGWSDATVKFCRACAACCGRF
jgi:hypothetical protein